MTGPVLWNDRDAAAATGGESLQSWSAFGVAFDSRQIAPGDLFVALNGETSDGHKYVGQALDGGAAAAMVARTFDHGHPAPLLLVPDTMAGLNDLARAARARCAGRICAITGSVGKTGTKEMLHHVLARQGAAHVSEKSFNNHVGTPLSLARMPAATRFGVFEIGMNAPGEIAPLSGLVQPNIAVITTIEMVHGATFDGIDGIAAEKADIFNGLTEDGVAVINGDSAFADYLTQCAIDAGAARIVRFGETDGCDVRLLDWRLGDRGTVVKADVFGRSIEYQLGFWGRHQALNSLAVLAVVVLMDADVDQAAAALSSVAPPPGRGQRHRATIDGGDVLVIDESYNCSPAALHAALGVLRATPVGDGGRRVAVIGDMLELGDQSAALHVALAEQILESADLVVLIGDEVAHTKQALPAERCVAHVQAASDALAPVVDVLRAGDVVMVKGSRRVGLETVVEALLRQGAAQPMVGNG
ncbi:MAG: UDP-N-acetylmuramoyl-tripeptide--D-alanyl-D-alanine ligase [Pseudomonadota bacterium]